MNGEKSEYSTYLNYEHLWIVTVRLVRSGAKIIILCTKEVNAQCPNNLNAYSRRDSTLRFTLAGIRD